MEEIFEKKHTLWEYNSVIPKDICEQMIKKYDSNSLENGIISNYEVDLSIRNVKTLTLDKSE